MTRVEVVPEGDWQRASPRVAWEIGASVASLVGVTAWDVHVAHPGQVRVFVNADADGAQVADALWRSLPAVCVTQGEDARYYDCVTIRFSRIKA